MLDPMMKRYCRASVVATLSLLASLLLMQKVAAACSAPHEVSPRAAPL